VERTLQNTIAAMVGLLLLGGQAGYAVIYVWSGGGAGGVFGAGTAWDDPNNWVDTAGNPVASYPDDLTDVAYINRSGTPFYSITVSPSVTTPASGLTVGEIRSGQAYNSRAELILGGALTVNKLYLECRSGGNVATLNGNTVTVVGTGAAYSYIGLGGSTLSAAGSVIDFQGSGSIAPGYGVTYGDIFVGNDAGDAITFSGTGHLGPSGRLVFGPGPITLTGVTHVSREGTPANNQYLFESSGTVSGPVNRAAGEDSGLRVRIGNFVLQPGNHAGIRLMSNHWTGGSMIRLDGDTVLGDLDLHHSAGRSDRKITFDVDLDANDLTVAQNLRIGQRAELILRSSTAHFDDVLIDYVSSQLTATNAEIYVSGNWDSSAALADPLAGTAGYPVYLPGDELAIGTSGITFTGIGKTIRTFAADAANHQTIFDLGFYETSRYTLLSDLYSSGGNILVDGNPVWIAYLTNHGILDLNGYGLYGFVEVPEPAAAALLALLGSLAFVRRPRTRQAIAAVPV
jgi:hypothetical protein